MPPLFGPSNTFSHIDLFLKLTPQPSTTLPNLNYLHPALHFHRITDNISLKILHFPCWHNMMLPQPSPSEIIGLIFSGFLDSPAPISRSHLHRELQIIWPQSIKIMCPSKKCDDNSKGPMHTQYRMSNLIDSEIQISYIIFHKFIGPKGGINTLISIQHILIPIH